MRLFALLTVRRSNSVYRSFSALAALIRLSQSYSYSPPFPDVYLSFAMDGCIFRLETLALSLGDSCIEKEYLLALVDLGRASCITTVWPFQTYDSTAIRAELFDAIHLQQCVPFRHRDLGVHPEACYPGVHMCGCAGHATRPNKHLVLYLSELR